MYDLIQFVLFFRKMSTPRDGGPPDVGAPWCALQEDRLWKMEKASLKLRTKKRLKHSAQGQIVTMESRRHEILGAW